MSKAKAAPIAALAILILSAAFSAPISAQSSSLSAGIDVQPSVLQPPRMAWNDGRDAMGDRLFRTTTTRNQINLSGWWDFVTDPQGKGEANRYFEKFPAPETSLWVPGTWNIEPRYFAYLGTAWYHRDFDVPQDGDLLLHFSAVFLKAKVWMDGRLLGAHEEAYLPFSFLVRNVSKGRHSLVVSVDNRTDNTTLPQRDVDWFPFGGIHRPVYAEIVPSVYIDHFNVSTVSVTGSTARLHATVWVRNAGQPVTQTVTLSIDNKPAFSEQRRIASGASQVAFDVDLPNPRLWSPGEPNLYSARLAIGSDDQFTRFGVRTIAVRGDHILLNGHVLKIRGVNRHEDHPDWGAALPPQITRQDVEIIKRLGANAVRTHYPVADMFLDYCDQNGLLFLSEMPAWQYRPEQLASPAIQEKMKHFFRDMVKTDAGHPSILYWSLGNEWPDPDKSYEVVKELVQYAHSVDPSHLITLVTGGPTPRRLHALLDIICVNWAKYQWYDPGSNLDAKQGEESIAALEHLHESYPDKPVILTEFGGAESQAGWHSWGNAKWSEEYQTKNVVDSGQFALDHDWIAGGCVWQFADARSAPERVLKGRLHGWNGKGIVDEYRNPKLAYYGLQQIYLNYQASHPPQP